MSTNATTRMIKAYMQQAQVTLWFTGMFQAPSRNFHNSEEVEIDIQREDEEIAIVVTDLSTGYRMNSNDIYTNKKFIPPLLREAFPINTFSMIKRVPGQDPFQNPDFLANATVKSFDNFRKMENKIRRTLELQASQILTTGTVTLYDESGNAVYTIDFKPKATHIVTAGTAWDQVGSTKYDDLESLGDTIRDDGLEDPDELHFGQGSWTEFVTDTAIQALFDNRRINQGSITPSENRGNGGKYRGTVEIGAYKFDCFTYNGKYIAPETGSKTKYLPDDKVVMKVSGNRMDATFGAIPQIIRPNQQLMRFMPGRIRNSGNRTDLQSHIWASEDGTQLKGSVGTRPLMIPTTIDKFGCLDTGI